MSAGPEPGDQEPADQPAVVVAGDALVELAPARMAEGAAAFQPRRGGSCLNVAAGLGRLRVPTALLARLSDDHFGDLLRAHLAAFGTRLTHALPASDPTTLAAVQLREDGSAASSFYANGTADRGLCSVHLAALPDGGALSAGTALHLGSLGLLLEPLGSTLDGLIRREAGRRLVSLDPNVRPGLIPDRAAYLRRFAEWVALADVVRASGEDLAWLRPHEPYEAVAERWIASGAGLVLITFGSRAPRSGGRGRRHGGSGRRLHRRGTRPPAPRRPAQPRRRRRSGAGDLTRLLSYAVEIAADTCTRAGAQPPYHHDDEPIPV
ncbi:PfkB family carbohydrate kinase [Streptomyces sp. NPDC051738]|uniref:PfkB family carbohydrate kinase n=1 Tax=Streptomyces sp. NPDC051738 TaxID=3365672 RepID=UPI0037D3FD21